MKKIIVLWIIVAIMTPPGIAISEELEKVKSIVSIPPQAYFVERVGGRFVSVKVLVGPGKSPATYEPTPKQIAGLGESSVYFRIGTPFENGFVKKLSETHKSLKIVDTRKDVKLRTFKRVELQYLKKVKAEQIIFDPHIWLDPKQAGIQAATICETLSSIAPKHRHIFEKNLISFQTDLELLDRKFSRTMAPFKGEKFYVFHPAFGYIADAYGLVQIAVEIEGKEPTAKQLSNLIEMAKNDGVRVIFVQSQFARKSAKVIAAAINGAVVPLDPLSRNYLENLAEIMSALKKEFESR